MEEFGYTVSTKKRKVTKPTSKTKEGKVKDRVRSFLRTLPNCWWYMPSQGAFAKAGVPDFIGCLSGRMFAIETKSIYSSHKVTALQAQQLQQIEEAGGIALVINENNVDKLGAHLHVGTDTRL